MQSRRFSSFSIGISLLLLALISSCTKEKALALEGSYQTVSESEWNIKLTLKKGGMAEIAAESWEPGGYESRSVDKTEARWSADGVIVTLEYSGIMDKLVYDEKLSRRVLGEERGMPGLIQIRYADPNSLLANNPLWKIAK